MGGKMTRSCNARVALSGFLSLAHFCVPEVEGSRSTSGSDSAVASPFFASTGSAAETESGSTGM
nr:unnamed protein product [Callosobruchus analis]